MPDGYDYTVPDLNRGLDWTSGIRGTAHSTKVGNANRYLKSLPPGHPHEHLTAEKLIELHDKTDNKLDPWGQGQRFQNELDAFAQSKRANVKQADSDLDRKFSLEDRFAERADLRQAKQLGVMQGYNQQNLNLQHGLTKDLMGQSHGYNLQTQGLALQGNKDLARIQGGFQLDQTGLAGEWNYRNALLNADTSRYSTDVNSRDNRYSVDVTSRDNRYQVDVGSKDRRYGIDQNLVDNREQRKATAFNNAQQRVHETNVDIRAHKISAENSRRNMLSTIFSR